MKSFQEIMKYLIAFVVIAYTLCVLSSPLDRLSPDKSVDEIKDEILKILEDLEIKIPDGIKFPPRVKAFKIKQSQILSEIFFSSKM